MGPKLHLDRGHVFWFDSGTEAVGAEEQGLHPWIVISTARFALASELVLAVPCTSNPIEYPFDVTVPPNAIAPRQNVNRPLDINKSMVAKARKIRHLSVARIEEIVAHVSDPRILLAIHAELHVAFGRP